MARSYSSSGPTFRASAGDSLWRSLSGHTAYSAHERDREEQDQGTAPVPPEKPAIKWSLSPEVEDYALSEKLSGIDDRKLGVTWTNLSVYGEGRDAAVHENIISAFNIFREFQSLRRSGSNSRKTILDNVHGCVKPGEMLLVLGRPGAGSTTLLNILANNRNGYAEVAGDVHFGSMDAREAQKYRGQIVVNNEDEVHFPTLTVGQTMDFATKMKVPFTRPRRFQDPKEYQKAMKDFLLRSMGISHTHDTKVGNEYVRGVSGGERKRVSIIECMATRGSVMCWDNSTRGLDASTALDWARAVRAMTDVLGIATIATLYQAGNGIYEQFDKVLVLDEGKEIFYGPVSAARPFMEAQGFVCDDAANVADFLTGVTVPTERVVREDMQHRFPRTAAAIRDNYEQSEYKRRMEKEYNFPTAETTKEDTETFKAGMAKEKNKRLPKNSVLTVSFLDQVLNCAMRQYQILWGDKSTLIIKQASGIIQALVAGSLFFDASGASDGLFIKGGALFYSILYNTLVGMSETTNSFTGRPVLAKHKQFALYHPAAFCAAQIFADLPIIFTQVSTFSLILYFMVGLERTASGFFTYWIILFTTTICMTAFFRLCGAAFKNFDNASKVSGLAMTVLSIYIGYMQPKPDMHPWFVWVYWINPLAYAFEALLSNEFSGKIIPCVGPNLVPAGPGYGPDSLSACTGVLGAEPGANFVTGEQYLDALSYSRSHLWRNLGIVWAWWALFAGLTMIFTTKWRSVSGGSTLLIPRELKKKVALASGDVESNTKEKDTGSTRQSIESATTNIDEQLVRNTSVFTWKNLCYTVKTPSGDRQLLDHVHGWVKPGTLGALMGSSGAGKTTLMDVLAQRKTEGTITGSIMVDGRPLPVSFQRSAGYCEQLDVHEPYATVREALEFSALLRQSRDTPKAEKLRYVDTVIDLLELHDLENTLIGTPGAGLSIEQRKRVTIGVELVAKPSILIFLDEPTSGLDGQAAFNTLRFLKKLAAAGQAVLCTIHQPSAQLFAQFDSLLLLAKGGKTGMFSIISPPRSAIEKCLERDWPSSHVMDHLSSVM